MPRGVTVPDALRETVIRLSSVFSPQEVRDFTDVSERQQKRIISRWLQTGSSSISKEGRLPRGRPRHLTAEEVAFIHGSVNRTCDIYLDELQDSLGAICGTTVSLQTIWRTLIRGGYRMKKLTKMAIERSARKRADYILKIATQYETNQLVFVDESAADRRTTYRGYAWAIAGRRAVRKAFFVRGRRYSILPALSLEGIMALDIVEGSFNSSLFAHFIHGLLDQMNPFPLPNSVVVMDNCRIHKDPAILDMITARGMRYQFLPPYSPDYNLIELAFSAIKSQISRQEGILREAMSEHDDMNVYLLLSEAVYAVTAEDAQGWFQHSGYSVEEEEDD